MGKKDDTSISLKRSRLKELRAEFRKITWPDKKSLVKKSVAVILSAIVLGVIIAGVDTIITILLDYIIG